MQIFIVWYRARTRIFNIRIKVIDILDPIFNSSSRKEKIMQKMKIKKLQF